MPEQITDIDLELLAELEVDITPDPVQHRTAREERIIAGFEEIQRFVEQQGRLPQHGDDLDIFERIYAVRLEQIRQSEECREVLTPFDTGGLLDTEEPVAIPDKAALSDEELLASLGIDSLADNDVAQLTHVRSRQEIKAAEEVAQRIPCPDFEQFKPLFEAVQDQLATGERKSLKYQDNAAINLGDLFILDGNKALVAEVGESFISDYGRPDCRLRVVYDNGTESDLLLRSLQRALNKDKTSRRITTPDLGPLFTDDETVHEAITGYIYVLKSQSDDPFIASNRSVIHKIGVTGGDVKKRIANAKKDPTYLLADVEIVRTFELRNINRKKFETLLQKFLAGARLDIELKDRFGAPVRPKEWFLVPLETIETVIEKIMDGTIDQYQYDPTTARLLAGTPQEQ